MARRISQKVLDLIKEYEAWKQIPGNFFHLAWCKLVYQEKGYGSPNGLYGSMRYVMNHSEHLVFRQNWRDRKKYKPRREKLLEKYGVTHERTQSPIR